MKTARCIPGNPEQEAEANYFAMHLLVPDRALRAEIDKIGMVDICEDDPKKTLVKQLARTFQVSDNVIAMRLSELRFDKSTC